MLAFHLLMKVLIKTKSIRNIGVIGWGCILLGCLNQICLRNVPKSLEHHHEAAKASQLSANTDKGRLDATKTVFLASSPPHTTL